jgi:hypothetical protein
MKYFKGVLKAYQNYKDNFQNVGFQESMVKTKKFLAIHGFTINTTRENDDEIMPEKIKKCTTVTRLLNKKYKSSPFFITANNNQIENNNNRLRVKTVIPSGNLLLQTISQTLYCAFVVFSTRSSPILIKPFLTNETREKNIEDRKKTPVYSILKHTDSYLPQKSYWYPLEFKYPTERL